MRIYFLHHSAVCVELGGTLLIFDNFMHDPDKHMQDGYIGEEEIASYERVYFFVSHSHFDHFSPRIFDLAKSHVKYILDDTVPREGAPEGTVYMHSGDEYDDGCLFVREFASTDIGGSFYIRCQGTSLFHAGDLNDWHWKDEGNERYSRVMTHLFTRELAYIRKHVAHIDVAFFPVDKRMGTDYDSGAKAFIETMEPDVLIPIHFQSFEDTDEFCKKMTGKKTKVIPVHHKGERLI